MQKPAAKPKRTRPPPPNLAAQLADAKKKQERSRKNAEDARESEYRKAVAEVEPLLDEWVINDRGPEDDVMQKLGNKLDLAVELAETNPEWGPKLSAAARRADEDREARREERRLKALSDKGEVQDTTPVPFDDFITKKREAFADGYAGPSVSTRGSEDAPPSYAQRRPNDAWDAPEKTNIIRIPDPDEEINVDHMGTKRPNPLGPPGNPLFLPPSPGAMLSTSKLLDNVSVTSLESFINGFELHGRERLFHPADIKEEFAKPVMAYVSETYSTLRYDEGIVIILYISNPLFVHFIFERRMDKEKKRAIKKPEYRIYSWKGHAYSEVFRQENAPLPRAVQPTQVFEGGFE